jgi:mono/diheme cytochrome c family protein
MLVISLTLCAFGGMVSAGTLYQWKDESGHMHFTDNLSKVPLEYRANSPREMAPLKSSKELVSKQPLDGKALYKDKCEACHVIGYVDDGAREGLAWAIIDQTTLYPHTRDNLFASLRSVVAGLVDMPIVDISNDDLMAIADYLIKESRP